MRMVIIVKQFVILFFNVSHLFLSNKTLTIKLNHRKLV